MRDPIDQEKVDIMAMLYRADWNKMTSYDNDAENVEWHVSNCMTYIIQHSEGIKPAYRPTAHLCITEDWNERELLSLYRELAVEANRHGVRPDKGMVTRVKRALSPRRIVYRP